MRLSLLLLGISLNAGSLSLTPSSSTQTPPLLPITHLTLAKLSRSISQKGNVNPGETISTGEAKNPGLWWAKAQFGDDVLDSWLIYPSGSTTPGQINLLVNPQNWSSLDYIERYAFINHFGTVARSHGYNLKVLDAQKKTLASYICDFSQTPLSCNVQLQPVTRTGGLGALSTF
ncbi:MAG: hypothetical protein JOZ78_25225 [Chroococcidiopsidaceae cyanobacterium CP_BM_ER_R8_30]|nr:hypothetical protein [Chroococcidiopsidaceae cyanobacterium CP_BM_ER_R8_30]